MALLASNRQDFIIKKSIGARILLGKAQLMTAGHIMSINTKLNRKANKVPIRIFETLK